MFAVQYGEEEELLNVDEISVDGDSGRSYSSSRAETREMTLNRFFERERYIKANSKYNVKRLHKRRNTRYAADPFHSLVNMPWWRVSLLYSIFFLGFWFVWAVYYYAFNQTIRSDRTSHSLWDCYFFSVQTSTSIGFGGFTFSDSGYAGAALECISFFFFVALFGGLCYAKFARAAGGKQTMLFSKVAVIQLRDGVPNLIFRVANVRKHVLIDVYIKMYFGYWRKTAEGVEMYDVQHLAFDTDMQLYPLVGIPFEVSYPLIGPKCPISGWSKEDLEERGGEFIVLLEGMPDITSQTLQIRTSYTEKEILWNHSFVPWMKQERNVNKVDLDKVSEVEEIPRSETHRLITAEVLSNIPSQEYDPCRSHDIPDPPGPFFPWQDEPARESDSGSPKGLR